MSLSSNHRVVVTGFGPFGDHDYNPSWDVARRLADDVDAADARLLSVTFRVAAQFTGAYLEAVDTDRPTLFIHLGVTSRRDGVCFERRAHNHRGDTPDVDEQKKAIELPDRQPLVEGERPRRSTPLDVLKLRDAYEVHRLDTQPAGVVSEDCGTYVCNALYYHTLRACETARRSQTPADGVFVHIPDISKRRTGELGGTLAAAFEALAPQTHR